MSKWEDKVTRAAHIKKHTRGTSNEISFSVLDAAKNALDGDAGDMKEHEPLFGRIALFTLPGKRKKPVSTPTKERGLPLSTGDFVSVDESGPVSLPSKPALSTASASSKTSNKAIASVAKTVAPSSKPMRSPEEEIARRKARRKLSKIVAITIIILVTIGLLVAGALYLYRDYQIQQGNIATLDNALELIKDADETLFKLDEAVAVPFEGDGSGKRATVKSELASAQEKLQRADEMARATSLDLHGAKDKEAANQTVAAVAARRALVEQGTKLMDAADLAQNAYDRVETAWENVLKGDELARQAAQLVTDTTTENIELSKSKTNEALAAFDMAYSVLVDVENTYEGTDFTRFLEYIEKRQEAMGYALASDDAVIARDKEEATAQNNAYNIADAEAATLAKALPGDPSSIVDQAFKDTTAAASKAYSTARLQAVSADAFIRDYLGAETK